MRALEGGRGEPLGWFASDEARGRLAEGKSRRLEEKRYP